MAFPVERHEGSKLTVPSWDVLLPNGDRIGFISEKAAIRASFKSESELREYYLIDEVKNAEVDQTEAGIDA